MKTNYYYTKLAIVIISVLVTIEAQCYGSFGSIWFGMFIVPTIATIEWYLKNKNSKSEVA